MTSGSRSARPPSLCVKLFAPYIIDPMSKYKLIWDLFAGFVFLFSYFLDPFIFGFYL